MDLRWEQIYAECRPPLYRAAAFLVGDAEGEEIVQDAFERAMRQKDFFDEVAQPLAWLRTVVVRLAVSKLRRRTLWERIFPLLERHDTMAASPDPDLEAAIRKLPPRQRAAIVLRYYFDADYAEIASTLGLSEASISKTLSRARAVLKEDLA
jgi:RNA polymerase sigma-70 factor (ECF subfamily)